MITDYHAKLFAHELSRRHSVADAEKITGALFDAQVDLNPHQVEAALFAFKSPLSKGAIFADEVGLGKTIEAGLVISQKWTEGRRRVLVICPANLRKQWAQEIKEKFFLPTMILESRNYNKMVKDGASKPFEQDAIVISSFHFSARKADELKKTPWDLVVIDEAHRLRNVYRRDNRIGRTLKTALTNAPKVLLTATPLQNSLMELYGLVSIIDDYAFGDAKSFRAQYARLAGEDMFNELKARLAPVCHRTLRRQVLEYIRYTNRIPITQEFVPTEAEQQLYDLVSDYLCRPSLKALPSSQRMLMTLIMRKLLASSTFAIANALDTLASKLELKLKEDGLRRHGLDEETTEEIVADYEGFEETVDEWADDEKTSGLLTEDGIAAITTEIGELHSLRDLAVSITENAKGQALLCALKAGFDKAAELGAPKKAIIFTESRRTQEYLVRLLNANGYLGQLMLFNGSNNDDQSKDIHAQWAAEHAGSDKVSGSRTADIRAALVDHFRNKASIMIATEAAAEGVNLQFCSMIVNYDLPWNPQRIEQRIGRCHRYGQKHDVVVVNFLNKKNAADQRVYELLRDKFQLFSGVFGASDDVLGSIESGVDFERRIVEIYQTCRMAEDIEAAFKELQAEMEVKNTEKMNDTRQKLLEHFDAEVHERLKINMAQAKKYLGRYDRMLWALIKHELKGNANFNDDQYTFHVRKVPDGIDVSPGSYFLGKHGLVGYRFRLGHPLARYTLERAGARALKGAALTFNYSGWRQKAAMLEPFAGGSGVIVAHKLSVQGTDTQDHIILAGIADDGKRLDTKASWRLFDLPIVRNMIRPVSMTDKVRAVIEAERETILVNLETRKAKWFDEEMERLDHWADDKRAGLKIDLKDLDEQIKVLKKQIRQTGNLPDKLMQQRKARDLETKREEAWREYDAAAKEIGVQKDGILDRIEMCLRQEVSDEQLFIIRFEIV